MLLSFYPSYVYDVANFVSHNNYMVACLSGGTGRSSKSFPELVDHRFFFDKVMEKDGPVVLNYTCGLARNAVARELHGNKVNLSDIDFWRPLRDHINNPCVTGFIIEQVIISRISFSGLNIAGKGLDKSMPVVLFSGTFPDFQTGITEPLLYCPQKFNYPNIDAIIVRIESKPIAKRQKVFMYPLQITLTPDRHSDSHRKFFDDYKSWTEPFKEFDVVPTFLWISPRVASPKKHNPTNEDDWPAHYEEYVPINQVHPKVWGYYMRAKLEERQTRGAPQAPTCGDGRREMEKQGVSEELGGPREQVRSDRPSAAVGLRGSQDRRKVYQSRTVAELKLELESRELSKTGNKRDLVNRLVEDDGT